VKIFIYRQTEPDYHSINDGVNLVESIVESEVTDVQHVLSGVVESVESEEINEYLIDQEITENMEISEMAVEQVYLALWIIQLYLMNNI